MLDRKKQDLYIANPQRWNRYTFVLNNPLRYVDPDGLAEVPEWDKLDEKLRNDLSVKLGSKAKENWNSWSNDQRQNLLNQRAVLIEAGIWDRVCAVQYGNVKYDSKTDQTTFTADNKGYALAVTVDAPPFTRMQTDVLTENGFPFEMNLNHPENSGDYMGRKFQTEDGIILHLGILKKPAHANISGHFDSGGGMITNPDHFRDWWNRTGPSPDTVTSSLGTSNAARHLRGISESMDRLLTQKKP